MHTVSMVFQHFGLLAHRRVLDNVAFGLEVQGVPKAGAAPGRARARCCDLVGLERRRASSFPDELSGGVPSSGWAWPGRSPSTRS